MPKRGPNLQLYVEAKFRAKSTLKRVGPKMRSYRAVRPNTLYLTNTRQKASIYSSKKTHESSIHTIQKLLMLLLNKWL